MKYPSELCLISFFLLKPNNNLFLFFKFFLSFPLLQRFFFFNFWLLWVSFAAGGFSLVAVSRGCYRWYSFPMSQLFTSDGQCTEASASALVLPMNIQGWFPIGLTGLISLLSKEHSRIFSSTTIRKYQFSDTQPSLWCNSRAVECFLFLNFSPQFYRAESDFPLWSIITGVNIHRLPTPFLDFHYHLFSIFT